MVSSEKKSSNLIGMIVCAIILLVVTVPYLQDRFADTAIQPNSSGENKTELLFADVAIVIVYDTSGSMNDKVSGKIGKLEQKYVIANRALDRVIDSLNRFVSEKTPKRSVYTGLYTFTGIPCPLVQFNADSLKHWLSNFKMPAGGTPLGITINRAGQDLLKVKALHKHILVLSDGGNTEGADPLFFIRNLKSSARSNGPQIEVHIIGFNVEDKVFAPLKKEGVNIFSAFNEDELTQQLDLLLKEKILLEAEDSQTNATQLK